jgi:hypothetical protein
MYSSGTNKKKFKWGGLKKFCAKINIQSLTTFNPFYPDNKSPTGFVGPDNKF